MNLFYTVYVFELHNGKYLLCPSTDDCSVLECMYMYPEGTYGSTALEAGNIARLITTVEQVESWQIDGLVHLYMHKYGTNNVIGGSYKRFGQETSTSDKIKFIVDGLDELNARKDKCRKLLVQDLSADFTSQIRMYNNLVELKDQYHLDRSIIDDLSWLSDLIINGTYQPTYHTRYDKLMNDIAHICKRAYNLGIVENKYYFPYPRVYFDSRVLPYERSAWKYNYELDTELKPVFSTCELAIYTMINREDELLYDIKQIDIDTIKDKLLLQQLLESRDD